MAAEARAHRRRKSCRQARSSGFCRRDLAPRRWRNTQRAGPLRVTVEEQPSGPTSRPWAAPRPGALPDSAPRFTLVGLVPASLLPFIQLARLDRPIGWWLLLLPCWWSNALASAALGQGPHVFQLVCFLIGAVSMRGAGSTYNDIVDREIDAKVERTRHRPLPSGRVGIRAAWVFLVVQSLIGLAVVVTFDLFTIVLAAASLLIVALYPFAKRFTSWPQAVLGLAFAWGGLVGWSAAAGGALAVPAVLTYAAAIAWTIGYDTIYALQDIADDKNAGVKSTARLFGTRVKPALTLFFGLTIVLVESAFWTAGVDGLFAQLGCLAFAVHLAWQVKTVDRADRVRALRLFRTNRDAGLLLFAGLVAETMRHALG